MGKSLRILVLEDKATDAEILIRHVKHAGFVPEWRRVETEADFISELPKAYDLILSDYSLPHFDGLRAVSLLRERGHHVPFILVSGTVGEDVAVEAMKHGATDYLLKDRIGRLGSAVERAMREAEELSKRKQAEDSLKLFRLLIDRSNDSIEVVDPETGRFLDVNERGCQRMGYTREELLTLTVADVDSHGVTPDTWGKMVEEIRQSEFKIFESEHRRKDGSTFPIEVNVRYVRSDRDYLIAIVRDITERQQAELKIRNQLSELQRWHKAMLGREDRILELKHEVNDLLKLQDQPPRYSNPDAQ